MPMDLPSAEEALRKLFTFQTPSAEMVQAMQQIREQALSLALLIAAHCPQGADRSAAIRQLRETVIDGERQYRAKRCQLLLT